MQLLTKYLDSNYTSDLAIQRSTLGYIFNLGSAAISWSSKRQLMIALSTCEAEYMGQVNATKEAIQLEQLLEKLTQIMPNPTITPYIDPEEISENHTLIAAQIVGMDAIHTIILAIVIFYNNQGVIALAKDPTNYSKIKYIYMKYIFLREYISNQQVELRYYPIGDIVADRLTKPLLWDAFECFCQYLGL